MGTFSRQRPITRTRTTIPSRPRSRSRSRSRPRNFRLGALLAQGRLRGRGQQRFVLALALLIALPFTGCVSKEKADAKARAAFVAGQQQAAARMQQVQAQEQGPSVVVNGEVRNHIVPWTEGLTLAAAIVAADYYGATDPSMIYLVRAGRAMLIDTRQLLAGKDVPLQAGDVVQLVSQSSAPKPQDK